MAPGELAIRLLYFKLRTEFYWEECLKNTKIYSGHHKIMTRNTNSGAARIPAPRKFANLVMGASFDSNADGHSATEGVFSEVQFNKFTCHFNSFRFCFSFHPPILPCFYRGFS